MFFARSLTTLVYSLGDKATSESLEAIAKVVDEFLPKIKAVSSGATVNRMICGGCLDFKLQTTVSLFYCNDIDCLFYDNRICCI